jgi:hypothetical protein
MIEKIICKALNKVLGNFVEEITTDSLNVAVTSGRASLENLRVRPECIQEMGLPVTLNAGIIGTIVVDIPLTALRSKPIVVTISDVLVSLSPNRDVNVKRVLLQKQLWDWKSLAEDENAIDPESKLGRLVSKILDNLVVVIEDVHIRMEDTVTSQPSWHGDKDDPSRCFSIGVTLDRFELKGSVVGLDGEWKRGCEKKALRFLNKSIVIGDKERLHPGQERHARRQVSSAGFGIYCHGGERPLSISDAEQWAREMRDFIASGDWETGNQWLAGPVAASLKVSVDKRKEFSACLSRVWRPLKPKDSEFKNVVLMPETTYTTALPIRTEQLNRDGLHIYWIFETTKASVSFEVKFCSPGHSDAASDETVHIVQPTEPVDSHLQEIHGKAAVNYVGEFNLVWKSLSTGNSAQRIRYAVWLQIDSDDGLLERIPLAVSDAHEKKILEQKKFMMGEYAQWVKFDDDVPDVRADCV